MYRLPTTKNEVKTPILLARDRSSNLAATSTSLAAPQPNLNLSTSTRRICNLLAQLLPNHCETNISGARMSNSLGQSNICFHKCNVVAGTRLSRSNFLYETKSILAISYLSRMKLTTSTSSDSSLIVHTQPFCESHPAP